MFLLFPFFFSSRRRHTRCSRDWSSDVCSSDLLWHYRAVAPGGSICAGQYCGRLCQADNEGVSSVTGGGERVTRRDALFSAVEPRPSLPARAGLREGGATVR